MVEKVRYFQNIYYKKKFNDRISLTSLILRMLDIGRIDISVFHCVICWQLLLLCFPGVVRMNSFLNDAIITFCYKHLKCNFYAQVIFTFHVYLLSLTNNDFVSPLAPGVQ